MSALGTDVFSNAEVASGEGSPASLLDLISLWMDSGLRRLDFALTAKLIRPTEVSTLRVGASRARATYPRADRVIDGERERWIPSGVKTTLDEPGDPRFSTAVISEAETRREVIDRFLERRLDPAREPAVKQLVLIDPRSCESEIVTRSHHAAADLTSALLFLNEQLRMRSFRRSGSNETVPLPTGPMEPVLREHPAPMRKSEYAHAGASTRLWTRGRSASPDRNTSSISFDADTLRAPLARLSAGVTYNDLLGVAVLRMLRWFQALHGASTSRLSLWLPVNLRLDPWSGFGNGSSRIRVYEGVLPSPGSAVERARAFRLQVASSKEHGEWAVPERHPILSLPDFLRRSAMVAYLRRPWVDMGTMLFSHVEKLGPCHGIVANVKSLEILSNLDRTHAAGLAGITLRGSTQLTMTYDPALLEEGDIRDLLRLFLDAVEEIRRELVRCAA